jgi:hypothetical protein
MPTIEEMNMYNQMQEESRNSLDYQQVVEDPYSQYQ